ncbi:4296_t:CDS:2, partial [Funneliformis geosporum]
MPLPMFKTKLVRILSNILNSTSKFGIETINAFPLQGYHTEKKPYICVRTWNYYDQNNALKAIRAVGMCTASDNLNCQYYYRKEGTNLFRVSVNNYNPISDNDASQNRTLVLTWDIKTYSSRKTGEVSNAKYEEDVVFIIYITVHWKDDPEPLKQICLIDVETAPDPRLITVICENQTNLLKAFALCLKCLAPDIHIGVLEWIFNHMSLKPMSLKKITKWQYQYNMIKKFYPKAKKSSLAYYLRECNLDNKVDLSIHRINKYYEKALKETNATMAEQMREVAKYCIINTLSCQQLMVKHNVINEYREVASIAFILLFNTHYFAIGIKVRNLLSAKTGKYPGAYVFPLVKDLKNRRPVISLDFASLYPSLIMTYNLSPDKIILSRERAESLKESGKRLHEINFKYNSRDVLAWSIEHENQAEMKGLYPKVLKEFLIKRNSLKRCLAPLNDRKEELEKEISLAEIRGENITDALKSKYSSVSFIDTYLDTKSLALKVYMNTFYSEAENSGFPFFLRALASGDTDSLYLVCPEECFQKCDEAYDNGNGISKEEYWSRI